MLKSLKYPMCVRVPNGWCACVHDIINHEALSVRTVCGRFVTLPWGFTKRLPTCPQCLRVIKTKEILCTR